MSNRGPHHEVLIAGFGGQGVVLAGRLLATAALNEEREVVWAPSYGPEMRGGAVHCTVIVSSERIGSPEVSLADYLVIMDRASLERFSQRVKPGGLLVLNSSLISERPEENECGVLMIPANGVAEELGNLRVANVVMLGALLSQRPVVAPASLEEAIRSVGAEAKTGDELIELNLRALARGRELGREVA